MADELRRMAMDLLVPWSWAHRGRKGGLASGRRLDCEHRAPCPVPGSIGDAAPGVRNRRQKGYPRRPPIGPQPMIRSGHAVTSPASIREVAFGNRLVQRDRQVLQVLRVVGGE